MTHPRVSDHALIRYLEREYGMEEFLDAVRAELAESVHAGHETCGDGFYPCEGGGTALVKSCVVVTYFERRKRRR